MELRQLKYFEKAYEYQNFSEASRLLFISQSTLSQQIKQLEEELDILLFDRIGKRVVPTEAGKAFLPYARKAIQDAESGKQIIKDLKGLETGELHIGATYSLSTLLTDALMVFTQAHPKIKINIIRYIASVFLRSVFHRPPVAPAGFHLIHHTEQIVANPSYSSCQRICHTAEN